MTDVTVNPDATGQPQRTETGELIDQSPALKPPTTTDTQSQTTTPSSDRSLLNREADKPSETKDGDTKPDAPPLGAPEKYSDFKLPDGYTLDPEVGKEATTIFKDLNLNQEGAQKLVDLYAKVSREATDAPYKQWADLQKVWIDEIKGKYGADVEPGGKVLTTISRVIDQVLPPTLAKGFREAMDLTGAGSHPAFVEAFYELAKHLSEGTPVRGNQPAITGQTNPAAPARPSAARAMYPNLPSIENQS